MVKTKKDLQRWFDNLPFEDRFIVQKFLILLIMLEEK